MCVSGLKLHLKVSTGAGVYCAEDSEYTNGVVIEHQELVSIIKSLMWYLKLL